MYIVLKCFFPWFSLSLQPFETPFATAEGLVFDLLHVVPYIKKYGVNPITGQVCLLQLTVHLPVGCCHTLSTIHAAYWREGLGQVELSQEF